MTHVRLLILVVMAAHLGAAHSRSDEPRRPTATRNIVLVTTDGLRWQEVFRGAEESLMNKQDGGVANAGALRREFWRETALERREALMPFFWKTVAREGQVFGNADQGSSARVTNGKNFSYPGYNEMLTGAADPRVDSNAKRPNPNVSVFEWLNRKPGYQGKVAAVGSWDVYPYIFNVKRSGLPVNSGWEAMTGGSLTETQHVLNRMMSQSVRVWEDCRNDPYTFQVALEHLRRDTPRVFYIGFGDTDEYAHGGRYDHYLESAHHFDSQLGFLWNALQAHPAYRGTTSLVVTTDHGRGDPPRDWRSHGEKVTGSDAIWIAVLGPDTPALGERKNTEPVTQSQVAATLAALLGEDYNAENPGAARPIAEVVHQ